VEQGDPVDVILRVAEEEEAGLIVLGTQGRTGLDRVIMGSVAEKVVRKAPGSVLAVKAPRAKPGDNRVKVAPKEFAAT
jgi:nucleotide-binding universal stress UspA family protein